VFPRKSKITTKTKWWNPKMVSMVFFKSECWLPGRKKHFLYFFAKFVAIKLTVIVVS
jgi:hypothetical protein